MDHKRTFLFLEQILLKYNALSDCMKVVEIHDGLDFHFKERNEGVKLVEFIQAKFIIKQKQSKELISSNAQNNLVIYKYTYSLEMPPVCKDDIIFIPPKLCKQLGGISPLLLVVKIGT